MSSCSPRWEGRLLLSNCPNEVGEKRSFQDGTVVDLNEVEAERQGVSAEAVENARGVGSR